MKNPIQISIMGTSRWYPSAKGGLEGTGMRVALPLLLIAVLVSNVSASVTAKVYLADEEIPLALKDPNVPDVFRDIMVGTHLIPHKVDHGARTTDNERDIPNQSIPDNHPGRG